MSSEAAFQPSLFDDDHDPAEVGATAPVLPVASQDVSTGGSVQSLGSSGAGPAEVPSVWVGGWDGHAPTPTPSDHDVGVGGPSDRAFHLARVCANFPTVISGRSAARLVRLLSPHVAELPDTG